MPSRRGLLAPQNTFLDTIATRFDGTHSNFVLGNAQATGYPIVYCSDGFCELTGFVRAHVMGRCCSCQFLYGLDTGSVEREKLDMALESKNEYKAEVQLYKKNGSVFWGLLDIIPIKNEKRDVVFILVSCKDITHDKVSPGSQSDFADHETNGREEQVHDSPKTTEDKNSFKYQRRRSRAVLYHLSGQFDRQNRTKNKLQQFNQFHSISGKASVPEYKVQEMKPNRFIILHYGIFKIVWDWLILLCTFYVAIMVPYNAAFITADGHSRNTIYADVIVEFLFAVDIVLNFRTTFVSSSGQVVGNPRQIALNYFKGWFLLDLLAAIPFDLLYIFQINFGSLIHLLKVARLLRLARLLQKIERFSQYSAVVVALMMMMFALLAHWLACIWYAIGKQELDDKPANWSVGWLYELGERLDEPILNKTNLPSLFSSYVSSLYFTCSSLTSVGFGNVSANTNIEKIFSICAMLVGAMMHAVVFGNVTAIIQRMYARRASYHSKTKDLKDFFHTYHVPKPLKQRMQEYFQTMWSMNHGIEINEVLKDFPEEMRGEIGLHLNKEILCLPIFDSATQGCLKSISLQIRRNFCAPGEYLIHKGDAINYLYFLCSGSMEILKKGMVVAILGKGDMFGMDINFDEPVAMSCADVKSLTYCELQCVNIKGLVEELIKYPDFAEKFCIDIEHDLTFNLRDDVEDEEEAGGETSNRGTDILLPAISEDEEDEDKVGGRKHREAETPSHHGSLEVKDQNSSSPTVKRKSLLNGHVDTLSVRFESRDDGNLPTPTRRTFSELRRVNSAKTYRFSQRERKLRNSYTSPSLNQLLLRKHSTSEESLPAQEVHQELESMRSSMEGLDKRVNQLTQDVSSIGRDVKSLLELVHVFPSTPSDSVRTTPSSPRCQPVFFFSPSDNNEGSVLETTSGSSCNIHLGHHKNNNNASDMLHVTPGWLKQNCYSREHVDRDRSRSTSPSQISHNVTYPLGSQLHPDDSNSQCSDTGSQLDLSRRHSDGGPSNNTKVNMDHLAPKSDLCRRHSDGAAYKNKKGASKLKNSNDETDNDCKVAVIDSSGCTVPNHTNTNNCQNANPGTTGTRHSPNYTGQNQTQYSVRTAHVDSIRQRRTNSVQAPGPNGHLPVRRTTVVPPDIRLPVLPTIQVAPSNGHRDLARSRSAPMTHVDDGMVLETTDL